MKRLAVLLTAMIIIGTSQASMSQSGNVLYGKPIPTATQPQIATRSVPALVKSRIPKPKLFRSNPHRLSHFALIDDNDDIVIGDDDLATSYRRRDLQKIEHPKTNDDPDGIITEDIRWKLFLARTAAMIRYNQIHS